MYKICLANYWAVENEKDRIRIPKLKELLHEILGFTDEEICKMEEKHFSCEIAKNLTGEQVLQIVQPFEDWDVLPYLKDEDTGELPCYNEVHLYLQPPSPKDHYCDEPMVGREHLIDPFEYYKQEEERIRAAKIIARNLENAKPVVECPYCHSTNTKKITATSKAVNIALFGIFGNKRKYQWHCNKCGSDF